MLFTPKEWLWGAVLAGIVWLGLYYATRKPEPPPLPEANAGPMTTLPRCDDSGLLQSVRKTIAIGQVRNPLNKGEIATVAARIEISEIAETAYDADAGRRACRAKISLTMQDGVRLDGRSATYTVKWLSGVDGGTAVDVTL